MNRFYNIYNIAEAKWAKEIYLEFSLLKLQKYHKTLFINLALSKYERSFMKNFNQNFEVPETKMKIKLNQIILIIGKSDK